MVLCTDGSQHLPEDIAIQPALAEDEEDVLSRTAQACLADAILQGEVQQIVVQHIVAALRSHLDSFSVKGRSSLRVEAEQAPTFCDQNHGGAKPLCTVLNAGMAASNESAPSDPPEVLLSRSGRLTSAPQAAPPQCIPACVPPLRRFVPARVYESRVAGEGQQARLGQGIEMAEASESGVCGQTWSQKLQQMQHRRRDASLLFGAISARDRQPPAMGHDCNVKHIPSELPRGEADWFPPQGPRYQWCAGSGSAYSFCCTGAKDNIPQSARIDRTSGSQTASPDMPKPRSIPSPSGIGGPSGSWRRAVARPGSAGPGSSRPHSFLHSWASKPPSSSPRTSSVRPAPVHEVRSETLDQSTMFLLEARLQELRYFPREEQRKGTKELMVRWHPDKNPDKGDESTRIFQWLQNRKRELLGL